MDFPIKTETKIHTLDIEHIEHIYKCTPKWQIKGFLITWINGGVQSTEATWLFLIGVLGKSWDK